MMRVKTSIPILMNNQKIKYEIAKFWDKISPPWQKILGPHIHHGFYEDFYYDPSTQTHSQKAQEILLEKITRCLNIKPGMRILDVGCGMGGTSLYLAKQFGARVVGITLSSEQVEMAQQLSRDHPTLALEFRVEDAHLMESFQNESFDMVWSLESCEQFYDKAKFIAQAHRILKPEGQFMLATWCADQEFYEGEAALRYQSICKSFLLPYMPTIQEYSDLLCQQFYLEAVQDWSSFVRQSWALGLEELKKYSFFKLLWMGGFTGLRFIRSLSKMSQAFLKGQLRYGMFIARKR